MSFKENKEIKKLDDLIRKDAELADKAETFSIIAIAISLVSIGLSLLRVLRVI